MEKLKRNNPRILVLFLVYMIAGNLFAVQVSDHRPPAPPDSNQIVKMVEELDEALLLSKEQKLDITEIFIVHFEEVKDLMEKNDGDREAHHLAMANLQDDFEEQVIEKLTEIQITKFEEFMKNRQKRHGKNRPDHR